LVAAAVVKDHNMMRYAVTLAMLVAGLALLRQFVPTESPPQQESSTPEPDAEGLHVNPESIQFGERWIGDTCEAKIVLTNRSPETIKIKEVNRSCGCITVLTQALELLPGGSYECSVIVDTAQKQRGHFDGQVALEGVADRFLARKTIRFSGNLKDRYAIDCQPAVVNFGKVRVGEFLSQIVQCRCDSKQSTSSWEINKGSWISGRCRATEGDQVSIGLEGVAPRRTGSYKESLQITRGDSKCELVVYAAVISNLKFDREQIVEVLRWEDSQFSRSIAISAADGIDWRVLSCRYEGTLSEHVHLSPKECSRDKCTWEFVIDAEEVEASRIVKGFVVATCAVATDVEPFELSLPVMIFRR
jgi:hypothetical protein